MPAPAPATSSRAASQVDFNFRFSTESPDASLKARVESILKKHGLDYRVEWTLGAKPFLSRNGRLAKTVQEAAKRHTGRSAELSTTGGTSDARFIIDICPEVIELGPVNASIHKLNEHIEIAQLELLPRIYLDTLRALLLEAAGLIRDTARRFRGPSCITATAPTTRATKRRSSCCAGSSSPSMPTFRQEVDPRRVEASGRKSESSSASPRPIS